MNVYVDSILILNVLICLLLAATSRLRVCILMTGFQGFLLGGLMIFANFDHPSVAVVIMSVMGAAIKGIVLPVFLLHAMRETKSRRELVPLVGYNFSVILATAMLAFSFWGAGKLVLPEVARHVSALLAPAGLFTMLTGLFLMVSRRMTLTQAVGYLVFENGIYIIGVMLVDATPLLVELGILLDVFVGVFVMGIVIFHMQRVFDDIDSDNLAGLKDSDT